MTARRLRPEGLLPRTGAGSAAGVPRGGRSLRRPSLSSLLRSFQPTATLAPGDLVCQEHHCPWQQDLTLCVVFVAMSETSGSRSRFEAYATARDPALLIGGTPDADGTSLHEAASRSSSSSERNPLLSSQSCHGPCPRADQGQAAGQGGEGSGRGRCCDLPAACGDGR